MKCLTVEASSELSDIDPSLKTNVLKVDELETTTDASCKDTARRLSWWAGRENNATFSRRQQLMGFTHMQYSLLTDMTLDGIIQPCSQFMHDWMHGLFSKGAFNICLQQLLTSMEEAGLHTLLGGATGIYQYLYEYTKPWEFPAKRKCAEKETILTRLEIACNLLREMNLLQELACFMLSLPMLQRMVQMVMTNCSTL